VAQSTRPIDADNVTMAPGTRFGGYDILDKLGEGGMDI
jgi:hypothetical protein